MSIQSYCKRHKRRAYYEIVPGLLVDMHGIEDNCLYVSIHIHDQETQYERLPIQVDEDGCRYVESNIVGLLQFSDFKIVIYDEGGVDDVHTR